jgi:hypothetical protein
MPKPVESTAANAAITTSGNSSGVAVQPVGNVGGPVTCHVSVTAVSGSSPTLTVSLQWSQNNSTWISGNADETFPVMTSTGTAQLTAPSRAAFVRAAWTVTGSTPSFTAAIAVWS